MPLFDLRQIDVAPVQADLRHFTPVLVGVQHRNLHLLPVYQAAQGIAGGHAVRLLQLGRIDIGQADFMPLPVADTLKRADAAQHIGATVARAGLWQAQTPQLFQAALLQRALDVGDLSAITDEASAVEALGAQPLLVQGDSRNLKLTLPQDEYIVRLLLADKSHAPV